MTNLKPVKITNRNIMFTEPMGQDYDLNLGLIMGTKYNYIIDTGLGSGSVAPMLDYIGECTRPIIVINTHSHWDHVWGNWIFEKNMIIAHTECRELTDKFWDESLQKNSKYIDGEIHKCIPNMIFEDSLYFPDDGISIFHTPGHTSDSISVYDSIEKVLYAGDNIGDTETEIIPNIYTNKETFLQLIGTYLQYDFDFCISGHNKPQTKDVLIRMKASLDDAWERQNSK